MSSDGGATGEDRTAPLPLVWKTHLLALHRKQPFHFSFPGRILYTAFPSSARGRRGNMPRCSAVLQLLPEPSGAAGNLCGGGFFCSSARADVGL